jgi:hypothetical protein
MTGKVTLKAALTLMNVWSPSDMPYLHNYILLCETVGCARALPLSSLVSSKTEAFVDELLRSSIPSHKLQDVDILQSSSIRSANAIRSKVMQPQHNKERKK